MVYCIGLEEVGCFPESEDKTFQEQIYGNSNLFVAPEEQSLDRDFFFFFISPCRDLKSQHIKTSALLVMAKTTSSLAILAAGGSVGGCTETQLQ